MTEELYMTINIVIALLWMIGYTIMLILNKDYREEIESVVMVVHIFGVGTILSFWGTLLIGGILGLGVVIGIPFYILYKIRGK